MLVFLFDLPELVHQMLVEVLSAMPAHSYGVVSRTLLEQSGDAIHASNDLATKLRETSNYKDILPVLWLRTIIELMDYELHVIQRLINFDLGFKLMEFKEFLHKLI